MTAFFLESPLLLLLAWALVQIVLIWVWSVRRDRFAARLAWGGFAAIALLEALSLSVQTNREQIIALCRQLAREVDAGNVAAIGEHLADDFEAGGMDRNRFLDAAAAALSAYRVDRPRLHSFEFEWPDENTAVTEFAALCRVRAPRMYGQIPSRWRLTLQRADDEWRVRRIQSVPVPPLHVADLRQWLE
jgi:hypothetical protein